MVARRNQKAGNDQLPHIQARKRRAFLREDFRPDARLGMRLRKIQEDQAQRDCLRSLRRRGDSLQSASRTNGPHRSGCSCCPYLVLQNHAFAHR